MKSLEQLGGGVKTAFQQSSACKQLSSSNQRYRWSCPSRVSVTARVTRRTERRPRARSFLRNSLGFEQSAVAILLLLVISVSWIGLLIIAAYELSLKNLERAPFHAAPDPSRPPPAAPPVEPSHGVTS